MNEHRHASDPPETDATSELVEILAEAFVAAAPPSLGVAFVRELGERLKRHDEEAEVITLGPLAPARARNRRKAFELLRHALPQIASRLHRRI